MINTDLKVEIKELEYDFENEIKALEKIIFSNFSSIFFDVVLIKYDEHNTKKISICKWNSTKNLRNLMRMFYKQNIFYKNISRKENIYLAVTEKTKYLNFIWLDDIKLKNISEKQLEYLTLIETSKDNFQAFIKLDKSYMKDEIQQIKNYLIKQLKADKAASSYIQPMRLPGVFSHKRAEPFYVKIYKSSNKVLKGKELLKKISSNYSNNLTIQPNTETETKTKQKDFKNNIGWKKYSYYKKQLVDLTNEEFSTEFNIDDEREMIKYHYLRKKQKESLLWKRSDVEIRIDENIIDIYYVYQLLIRDYEKEEIFSYLYKNRSDLDEKHEAADYFLRTYLKALLFKKVFYPAKKLFENNLLNDYIGSQKEYWNEDKKVVENLKVLINNLK